MDIQVASNFERFLWWQAGEDTAAVRAFVRAFEAEGEARLETGGGRPGSERLVSGRADRAATLETIERWYRETGYLLDPHTAVGVAVAEKMWGASASRRVRAGRGAAPEVSFGEDNGGVPVVCLATAHPGKFPEARPAGAEAGHPRLAGLEDLPARKVVLRTTRAGGPAPGSDLFLTRVLTRGGEPAPAGARPGRRADALGGRDLILRQPAQGRRREGEKEKA